MTLEDLIRALSGNQQEPQRQPMPQAPLQQRAAGALQRIPGALLGLPPAGPIKMMPPAQGHQFPMGPGGVTGDPPPGPPQMPLAMEQRLMAQPLSALRPQTAPNMSAPPPLTAQPRRGFEPPSLQGAPPYMAEDDLHSQFAAAMARARSLPPSAGNMPDLAARSQEHLDYYRSQGREDLGALRDGRDRYSRLAQDFDVRRDRLPRR
jgi:hypothetical protein